MSKKDKRDDLHAGQYYGRTPQGKLVPLGDASVPPDVIICRRVADFPDATPPANAVIEPCHKCGAPVASNPDGPHRDRPRVCMQCENIQPLPIIVTE